nr:hypothetical protein BaRGS_024293 [Batillaria attramentaria]
MTVTPAENSPKRFGSKLLANRETGKKEMPQITVGDKVTQILVKSADSSPAPPERHRPYLKSLSQRELSAEEKENGLPDIFSSDKGTSSPNNKAGSSTVPLLPKLSKTRAVSLGNLHWKTETPPLASLCLPSQQDKKQRARCLWRKAGEKLGLHPNSTDGGDQPTWVLGPGDVLRPVYFRWQGRRNALADPERMCMPQEVRERIQQDVHNRKRSVARKVSNYLTCRLGLNLEVDLAAC